MSEPSQPSRDRPYWPALDGVRGVAVLLVVAYHLDLPYSERGGTIGVTMFFGLSGFLITTLLLLELDREGAIGLRGFYRRRAVRLLPALAAVLGAAALASTVTGVAPDTLDHLAAVAFYVGNWVRAFSGFDTLGLFEHSWSLSVEEQFYLVWPLAVIATTAVAGIRWRAVGVLAVAVAGSVASLVWRLQLWDEADPRGSAARVYNGTDAVADQILLGCALAAILHLAYRRRVPGEIVSPLGRAAASGVGWAAMAFLFWIAMFRPGGVSEANDRLYLTWGSAAFAAAAVLVVASGVLAPRASLSRLLATRPFVEVGKVSYGLYLWHYPVIIVVRSELAGSSELIQGAVVVVVSAAATVLSWKLVERPAQRFRHPRRARELSPVGS